MSTLLRARRLGGEAGRRVGGWRDRELADPRHGDRAAAWLGMALGVSFGLCFATGLLSHLIQHPPGWFTWPARPAGLYRVTQGVHVATGLAAIPLLLAKLWSVFPRLFRWPVVTGVGHALERLSLLPLVGGALFLLISGVANIDLWYPWPFFFPAGHYWVALITMGALVVHIGAKASVTAAVLRETPAEPTAPGRQLGSARAALGPESRQDRAGRRRFLALVGAGSAAITAVTVGQTVRPLRGIALLAPRRPDRGSQGFPVNKTAVEARVVDVAVRPDYRLVVTGRVTQELSLSLSELRGLPQRTASLPIACVEGWSASPRWTGVPVRDLLRMAGAPDGGDVVVESLQEAGRYRRSVIPATQVADRDTLLALLVEDVPLSLDHGYPVRLIGPNRPGVLQTKWVSRLEVR